MGNDDLLLPASTPQSSSNNMLLCFVYLAPCFTVFLILFPHFWHIRPKLSFTWADLVNRLEYIHIFIALYTHMHKNIGLEKRSVESMEKKQNQKSKQYKRKGYLLELP